MMVVFTVTGIIASVLMLIAVHLYPPAQGINVTLPGDVHFQQLKVSDQIVKAFTVLILPTFFPKRICWP